MDTEIVHLRDFKVKPLKVDYKLTDKYKTKLVKVSKDLTAEDMVPITYDVMFKTMFANTKRKKYLCRLFSLLFSINEEDAMRLFKFSKNELDKESIKDRRNTVDLVGTLGSTKVNVEMNKTDTLKRNLYYLEVISREDLLSGVLFGENLTVQINLTVKEKGSGHVLQHINC